jgi:hypothetical protein
VTVRAAADAAVVRSAVIGVVERIFATVDQVHAAALRSLSAVGSGDGLARMVLDDSLPHLLFASGQLAVGLGLVVAPRPGETAPPRFQWWQTDPEGHGVRALHPDLDPASLGYYDYTAADWFDVPRRTGCRHVTGPFVDVHGTGRYLLTLTQPVMVGGRFLGVVGADVPVGRFESHLLGLLGPLDGSFVLVNDGDRVVLSTFPRWLVGDLVPRRADLPGAGEELTGVPWRLHVADRADTVLPA